jgi:hypothetical protein
MSFAPEFGYMPPYPIEPAPVQGLQVGFNYQVASGLSSSRLAQEVNALASEGWLPVGGVFVKNGGDYDERYYQAMGITVEPVVEEKPNHFNDVEFIL